jgi:glycosyltransferase involved in cell wall biosynthesis
MNILELCLSPDYGGLELHMRDFSRWLSKRSDVSLFLCLQEQTHLFDSLQDLKVPTLTFPQKAGKVALKKAVQLARFIDMHAIDSVHVHWKFDLPLVAWAKRLSKKKFRFVHTRQMNMPGRKRDPYHRFIFGEMDCFIAITQYLENQARENLPLSAERIIQVYYGVKVPAGITPKRVEKLKAELKIRGDFTIGLLGRLSEYKGQHLLVEAVGKLKEEGIIINAWIIGAAFEPDYKKRLQKMIGDMRLADQIHFMDFYPNPIELMSCFDSVVLTTKNETFGLVLIEAMHAGVAVIGSDDGGVPEIIEQEKTGLLFESWNSDALAAAIKKLYQNSSFREELAHSGRINAQQKFDLEKQYQKFLEVVKG